MWGVTINGDVKAVRKKLAALDPQRNGCNPMQVAMFKELVVREMNRMPEKVTQVRIQASGEIGSDDRLHEFNMSIKALDGMNDVSGEIG